MTSHSKLHADELTKIRQRPGRSKVWICLCPFCSDRSGHFEADEMKGVWYCYRCGRGGRLAGAAAGGREGVSVGRPLTYGPPVDMDSHGREVGPGTRLWRYLEGRGFDTHAIRRLDPRIGPDINRVYFPVRDPDGQIQTFAGRTVHAGRDVPKWKFPYSNVRLSECLWGIHEIQPRRPVVLVEGIFDAVWSDDRVCVFGTKISDCQIAMLRQRRPGEITIFFDGDDAGREAARRVAAQIRLQYTCAVSVIHPPWGMDPCDMGYDGNLYLSEAL